MMLRNAETNEKGMYERGSYVWSLKMIVDAARLCAPYVKRNGREVWFQLFERLGGLRKESEVIKKFLEEIEEVAERPWVKATRGCLTEPGGRLYRTIICGKGVDRVDWICVSGDGERIVAVSGRGEELHRFIFKDVVLEQEDRRDMSDLPEVAAACWTRGGGRAAIVHSDGSMRVWDMKNEVRPVRVWDVESGEGVCEPFVGHRGWVRCVSFSGDGRRVALGDMDGTVRVWDVESGEGVGEPFVGHIGSLDCVSWSGDGRRVTSGDMDGTVRVWDVENGGGVGEPFVGDSGWIYCVSWSGDGRRVASGGEDGTVRVWDVESGEGAFVGHPGWVEFVAMSGDGRRVASRYNGTVRVWDVEGRIGAGELLMNNVAWAAKGKIWIRKSLFSGGDEEVEVLASFEGEAELCQFSDQTFAVGFHGRVFFLEIVE